MKKWKMENKTVKTKEGVSQLLWSWRHWKKQNYGVFSPHSLIADKHSLIADKPGYHMWNWCFKSQQPAKLTCQTMAEHSDTLQVAAGNEY